MDSYQPVHSGRMEDCMKKTLKYHHDDNVVVALENLVVNDHITVNGQTVDYIVLDELPMGHKVANTDIAEGELIIKYGSPIGIATCNIKQGKYVHIHNVKDLISDWRGYHKHIYDSKGVTEISEDFKLSDPPKLFGYRRKNGQVGFRNHILVLSTVVCANQIVQDIGAKYREVIVVPNPSGCVILKNEVERIKAILVSMARNPNVGAVIFVGLGCESIEAEWFYNQVKDEKKATYVRIQNEGSTPKAFEKLDGLVQSMMAELEEEKRTEVLLSDIRLGTKCGGSDWTTAVVSNPAIGYASDLVVKNGGISLLGETCGWFGGESMLVKQARTKEVADQIIVLLGDIYDRALAVGRRIEEGNPAPGNIEGGITTLNEKALGNVKKGGSAPVEGVLKFGEQPSGKGLYVTDNPGLDPVSLLGLTCASANIILFSTGRGTPTGTPLAPAIKLSGSPNTCVCFGKHLDADLSGVVTGEMSIEEAGKLLFDELIAVANGKETIAERLGHREFAFPMLMGPM